MKVKIKVKGKEFEVRYINLVEQLVHYRNKDGKWYHELFKDVDMFVKVGGKWKKV